MSRISDQTKFKDIVEGKPVGEAQPINHPSIECVIVVLKRSGDLTRQELGQVADFAKAAAVQAGRMR